MMTMPSLCAEEKRPECEMHESPDNPLLKPSGLPHDAPPFSDIKPEHFLPAISAAVAGAKKGVEAIKHNPAPPTFQNTVEALEFAENPLLRVFDLFEALGTVNSNDAMMAIDPAITGAMTAYESDVWTDDVLFARVKAVYDMQDQLPLDDEQKALLKTTYREFVSSGALLDEAGKDELRDIDREIAECAADFQNNIVRSIGAYKKIIDDEGDLAGLPDRVKDGYREAAEQNGYPGKWLIELSPPPNDIFLYSDNRALREEIHQAFNGLAYGGKHDNRGVLLNLVRLRHRRAQILGYQNHAECVLEERMVKNPETVMDFLEKLGSIYKPAAEKHLQQVRDFAYKADGLADFQQWDFKYYNRKLQEKLFKLDLEELRAYFDLEKVLAGLWLHAENLFNVTVKETPGKYPVYHPDVKVYEVTDKKTGEMLGVFYTDYYARPGEKNNGAWMEAFRERGIADGEDKCAIIINVCDFAKPAAGQPTLLSLEDVRTVFHEFGHGLHALLARGKYPSQNGTNVQRDYLELPSQLQENWAREEGVLSSFAVHHSTGEPLPPDLLKTALDLEKFNAAHTGMYMTFLSLLDMKWYTTDPDAITSLEDLEDSVTAEHYLFSRLSGSISTSFDHLEDYAAGFYSYKWDEMLDAQVFEKFRENGLYDPETAQCLRDIIYATGNNFDPLEIFKAMCGQDPDTAALLRREGLLPEKKDEPVKKPPLNDNALERLNPARQKSKKAPKP